MGGFILSKMKVRGMNKVYLKWRLIRRIKVENKLMTLDGLIDRLQEIRTDIGHNCAVNVQVDRGNRYSNGQISMAASDYRNGTDSVLIQIDYESLKWLEK